MYLTDAQINKIESMTNELVKEIYSDDNEITLPIKLSKLIEKHGFNIKSGNFPEETISGAYDARQKTIFISEMDPFPRQIFTIAHELAHFFLHSNKEKDVFYRSMMSLDDAGKTEENEANCFAASLLMPANLIKQYWEENKDISKVALWFGVTQSACYWRLKNLKLIE